MLRSPSAVTAFARAALVGVVGALGAAACAHDGATREPAAARTHAASVSAGTPSGGYVPPPITDGDIARRIEELRDRLSLDRVQVMTVRGILEDSRTPYEELRRETALEVGLRDPSLRERFIDLELDTEDRISLVLRCNQKEQLRMLEHEERVARLEQFREIESREARMTEVPYVLPSP